MYVGRLIYAVTGGEIFICGCILPTEKCEISAKFYDLSQQNLQNLPALQYNNNKPKTFIRGVTQNYSQVRPTQTKFLSNLQGFDKKTEPKPTLMSISTNNKNLIIIIILDLTNKNQILSLKNCLMWSNHR